MGRINDCPSNLFAPIKAEALLNKGCATTNTGRTKQSAINGIINFFFMMPQFFVILFTYHDTHLLFCCIFLTIFKFFLHCIY